MKIKFNDFLNENDDYDEELEITLSSEYSNEWGSFVKDYAFDNFNIDFVALDYNDNNELNAKLSGSKSDLDECILDMDFKGMINTVKSNVNIQ